MPRLRRKWHVEGDIVTVDKQIVKGYQPHARHGPASTTAGGDDFEAQSNGRLGEFATDFA
jgi:hypothetical protein